MINPTHMLLILPLLHIPTLINSLPCTNMLCSTCCIPYSKGCRAAYTTELSGVLVTDNISCKDCSCDHPVLGCGWIGKEFDKINCNACKILTNNFEENPKLSLVGCGHEDIKGELVYLD